jgi:nitrogen fixation NifU-like protein
MNDLGDLYQEIILDHYKKPRNAGRLEEPSCSASGDNPLCGDKISITVKKSGDKVEDIRWKGAGCAISTASASLMSEAIKGKSVADIDALFS